jgi:hypothetical protein
MNGKCSEENQISILDTVSEVVRRMSILAKVVVF